MDLLDHMEWVEALLAIYTKHDLDHKRLWVVATAQTQGGKDLRREEVFQNRRLLHCPSENLPRFFSLFLSIMAFTNTAFPGWFMKASMSVGDGISFSGLKDG